MAVHVQISLKKLSKFGLPLDLHSGVLGMNVDQETKYPAQRFLWFSTSPPGKKQDGT
jgi:hypothetical protein